MNSLEFEYLIEFASLSCISTKELEGLTNVRIKGSPR